ncbi:MAG: hypothetical protein JWL79_3854 [Frankiales bacterium]|nr:hypothetical protein [Frankiales bacterium]
MPSEVHVALRDLAESYTTYPVDAKALIKQHTRRKRVKIAVFTSLAALVTTSMGLLVANGSNSGRTSLHEGSTTDPRTGRYWLIDAPPPRHADGTFYDPADSQPTASPAPRESKASGYAALQRAFDAAGLPRGSTLQHRPDGYGTATDDAILPGGTRLLLIRDELDRPINFRMSSSDGVGAHILEQDVPGTRSAALIDDNSPYADSPDGRYGGHAVTVVAADGTTVMWVGPSNLNLTTLKGWAFSGAQGTVGSE